MSRRFVREIYYENVDLFLKDKRSRMVLTKAEEKKHYKFKEIKKMGGFSSPTQCRDYLNLFVKYGVFKKVGKGYHTRYELSERFFLEKVRAYDISRIEKYPLNLIYSPKMGYLTLYGLDLTLFSEKEAYEIDKKSKQLLSLYEEIYEKVMEKNLNKCDTEFSDTALKYLTINNELPVEGEDKEAKERILSLFLLFMIHKSRRYVISNLGLSIFKRKIEFHQIPDQEILDKMKKENEKIKEKERIKTEFIEITEGILKLTKERAPDVVEAGRYKFEKKHGIWLKERINSFVQELDRIIESYVPLVIVAGKEIAPLMEYGETYRDAHLDYISHFKSYHDKELKKEIKKKKKTKTN